jgi:hypothetical protein
MGFIVAAPAAPLQPTAVWLWPFAQPTQPLSLSARCAPRERSWATVMPRLAALHPSKPTAGLPGDPALDSGRGWRFVAPGCIFERGPERRKKSGDREAQSQQHKSSLKLPDAAWRRKQRRDPSTPPQPHPCAPTTGDAGGPGRQGSRGVRRDDRG